MSLLHGNILHVVNNFSKVLTEGVPKIDLTAKKAKAIAMRQAEQRAPPMPKDSKRQFLSQKSSISKEPQETSQKRSTTFRVVTNKKPKISQSNSNAMLERLV